MPKEICHLMDIDVLTKEHIGKYWLGRCGVGSGILLTYNQFENLIYSGNNDFARPCPKCKKIFKKFEKEK